ncbi:hypothetical protein B0T16DRAFT_436339 [Cercophora newfieldiana]|uniref:Microbial-type PARG catalytic domain-containing protein n=1 Tax=Cercophora newfieldiana TaxID=92897 RepID=A0AA39YDF8_9PEZI|nr:hypothetical protein B0T16DRAFT_436339 [Cercophora newfieldiana]
MPSGSSKAKQKPAEVAADTKKQLIPIIRSKYAQFNLSSYIYHHPISQLGFAGRPLDLSPPRFYVSEGDPADGALNWAREAQISIPLICPANDQRPGGDWETAAAGYEERLCRRSTLSATLATPGPGSRVDSHYPIPMYGGILSAEVVVFRGPHDRYEKLPPDQWRTLPVLSVPPARWPKLTQNGTKYSFPVERTMVKDKMRSALRICAYREYSSVVIGDFGLGNGYRNPPQELAELWREVLLYDPDLRGRIRQVAFVFEDGSQSTTQMILDDIAKKSKSGGSSSKSKSKSKSSSSGGSSSSSSSNAPTDYQIFLHAFSDTEIQRVLSQPDSRYGFDTLLTE